MLIQVKEGPEGLGRKNFKIWTQLIGDTEWKIRSSDLTSLFVNYTLLSM
jgi:hypothetical protein